MIEIKDLCYCVDSKILFEHANKKILEGQYVLSGNNGIGKSTLLNIVTKSIKPQQGEVAITCDYIYINQAPLLLENLTIKKNVNFFNKTNSEIIFKKLEELNINKNQKVKLLSGGQKQLIYLFISLYSNYDLYLIDEPFNNLDKNRIQLIYELIAEKENVIVVDHLKKFQFKNLEIKNRGIL